MWSEIEFRDSFGDFDWFNDFYQFVEKNVEFKFSVLAEAFHISADCLFLKLWKVFLRVAEFSIDLEINIRATAYRKELRASFQIDENSLFNKNPYYPMNVVYVILCLYVVYVYYDHISQQWLFFMIQLGSVCALLDA